MRHLWLLSVLAVATALPGVGAAQSQPAPNVGEPIVIGLTPPAPSFADLFVQDAVPSVTCDRRAITPVHSEPLPPMLAVRPPGGPDPAPPAAEVFTFAISAAGRPASIRPAPSASRPGVIIVGPAPDAEIQASLASWRFAPEARKDCRLALEKPQIAAADASEPLLARALALAPQAARRPALRAALMRPGDTCLSGTRARTRVHPDLRSEPPPGGRSWAAVRYSLDPEGRTYDVSVLDASSEAAGEALRDSMTASTYAPGRPLTGCVTVVSLYGEPLGFFPPLDPDLETANRCGPETADRMTLGELDYPDAMLSRGVEGWAVIRFDLASWGRVGGIEVLASEPAASFGAAAQQIFRNARVTPAFEQAAGCVQRVVFRLPVEGETGNAR
jgi:TonB family protein